MEDKIIAILKNLLNLLSVDFTSINVVHEEEYYYIDIQTPESGLLIGYHGETLQAMELLTKMALFKETNEWIKLSINVADYRQKKEEKLKSIADQMVNRLEENNLASVVFPYLSAGERRVIHLHFKNNPQFEVFSDGEGMERRLILQRRQKG